MTPCLVPDSDLVVPSAQELQRSLGAPADEVARAVHARPAVGEGVGYEGAFRGVGSAEVAAGDSGAADHEFAGDPKPRQVRTSYRRTSYPTGSEAALRKARAAWRQQDVVPCRAVRPAMEG
ncbi:hypothetical protein GCM10010344_76420 [Streptomyces bluensis]|nr:hypothetical protein GCM10010344_76420 [Streptomyces bluensis]